MKFSVVIPVYKTERFLPRCLDSLVAQTDGDFEAIVVDDCSPGDAGRSGSAPYQAEEIVKRYDARFKCVRHATNRGAFQARCTGVAAATGAYVVPVDPDDYLMPETLAKLYEVMDRDAPDIVSYWIDYDDGENVYPHWCRHAAATVTGEEALRELAERKYFTGVASKAFRRETLLAAVRELEAPETLRVNTGDDFLMLAPMLLKSVRVTFLDFAGYRYFVNRKSATFGWRTRRGFEQAFAQMRQTDELVRRRANRPDVPEDMRAAVERTIEGLESWFRQTYRDGSWICRLKRFLTGLVFRPRRLV